MERSAELQDLVLRLYEAAARGDFAVFERYLSHQEGVLVIGTDPSEWWRDFASILTAFTAQAQEMGGGMPIVAGEVHAYAEGTVGWGADHSRFALPDGTEVPFRSTFVFHREGSDWRMVQWHISVGVRNEEVVGKELTV